MAQVFSSFLLTSAVGTVLACLLLVCRPLTRRVFSAHWHYYMWLVVLAVMLLPVSFTLPEVTVTPHMTVSTTTKPQINQEESKVISVSYTPSPVDAQTQTAPVSHISANSIHLLSGIWIIGIIAFFLIKSISYGIFLIKLRKYSSPTSCYDLSSYTKRKVIVRLSNKISSPLITGVFSPILLLPDINMEGTQLHNILSHEMVHLKRGDILYKWLVTLVKCVHWFNPAIYFMAKKIDADCEISCDMAAVKNMTDGEKKSYMETILSLISQSGSKPSPMTTGMTGNKDTLKRRFVMIKSGAKFSKKAVILSIIISAVILVTSVFASGILSGKIQGILPTEDNFSTDKVIGDDFNLLFVGVDNCERADTIMLIKYTKDGINGISIPRDTRITNLRISDMWNAGGMQAVIDALRQKLNEPVHYYAKLNLSGVTEIIDALGGVDFYVPMDMEYSDPYQNLDIKLKEGYSTLNGDGVKQLLQFRPGRSTHGDLTRIDIHQQFVKSFAKGKVTAENLAKSQQIFKLISENLDTNYPVHNLKNNTALLTAIQNNKVNFETISGYASTYNGMPVYELSQEISFIWPTESTNISRGFETRTHPITGEVQTHNGVDIKAEENAPVYSAIYGTVTETGYDSKFGNYVIIQDDAGIKTFYGHLSEIFVEENSNVNKKTVIGKVGRTGQATGANLHFEIMQNGTYLNPEDFLSGYNEYHDNIDYTVPTSVINGFFKAFESGDYDTMKKYCTEPCINSHFMKSDDGKVFNVFGMSMATLRSVSEPDYLKGDLFLGYTVNVSCKTPEGFSIIMSKNSFRVFLEKQKDGSYLICDLSH